MEFPLRTWLAVVMASGTSALHAGERLIVEGYATQLSGGILLALRPAADPVFSLAAPPLDRHFVSPARVRWEIEPTGTFTLTGLPEAKALRTAPANYAWPSGEELSPVRFAGASNAMNPFENPLDPLGVAPGGPPDYDQDGIADTDDAFPGDPNEAVDSDGDGSGNNTDPDDDNDGMPDTWEIANGLNPFAANANSDPDFDGFSNFEEYEADTSPLNGGSRLRVAVSSPVPGTFRMSWTAMPGRSYSIWHWPSFSQLPVAVAQDIRAGSRPVLEVRDFPATAARGFYFLKASVAADP